MFRRNKKPVNEQRKGEYPTYILKPGCGLRLMSYQITEEAAKKGYGTSTFRILPSFDENGNEDDALNPQADVTTEFAEAIGLWAHPVEIVAGLGSRYMTFISETWVSETGKTFTDKWTMARQIIHRLRELEKELQEEIIRNGPTGEQRFPKAWLQWFITWDKDGQNYFKSFQKKLKYPYDVTLLQVMARSLSGVPVIDKATGQPGWIEDLVMWLPPSASSSLFQSLKMKSRQDMPLSPANNLFGDCISCAEGHCFILQKRLEKNKDYGITLEKELTPLDPEYVKYHWKPWENILLKPTLEQVMQLMAEALSWEAVAFGMMNSSYDELIPEQYRAPAQAICDRLNAPVYAGPAEVSAPVPPTTQAPQAPQTPPAPQPPSVPTRPAPPALKPAVATVPKPVMPAVPGARPPAPPLRAPVPGVGKPAMPPMPGVFQPGAGVQGPKPGRFSPTPPVPAAPLQPTVVAKIPSDAQQVEETEPGEDDIPFKGDAAQGQAPAAPSVGLPEGIVSPEDAQKFQSALAGIRGQRK